MAARLRFLGRTFDYLLVDGSLLRGDTFSFPYSTLDYAVEYRTVEYEYRYHSASSMVDDRRTEPTRA